MNRDVGPRRFDKNGNGIVAFAKFRNLLQDEEPMDAVEKCLRSDKDVLDDMDVDDSKDKIFREGALVIGRYLTTCDLAPAGT